MLSSAAAAATELNIESYTHSMSLLGISLNEGLVAGAVFFKIW